MFACLELTLKRPAWQRASI